MNRLQTELLRLYLPPPGAASPAAGPLVDAAGAVRAMVLELRAPADWQALGVVWQGVQTDLALPAPAIAVSGTDACQLWFSLAQPLPAAQAIAFLDLLRQRYLTGVVSARVRCLPAWDQAQPPRLQHAPAVPAPQEGGDRWSAFVSPELAPMFAQTPWLDVPPSPDGQAGLLARLGSIGPGQLHDATALLQAAAAADGPGAASTSALAAPAAAGLDAQRDPRRFLLDVMNDERVALALRIEAAKALLLHDSRA